jgi:hypothetical protein
MNYSLKNPRPQKRNIPFKNSECNKNLKGFPTFLSFATLLLVPLVFSMVLFTSCQEEIIEITQEAPEDIFLVNSEVATLVKSTVTNDGSKDNILDKSSCFNVVLPVHVFVNSLEVIIDEEEDFEVIEAIFDEFEDDDDLVEFAFPIKIVLADFSEITIENQAQLMEYMDSCAGENEEDDDIECIDFQYPISFSLFNSDNNLIDTKTVENDKQMYNFIEDIKSSDIVSINFPIEVILTDDTVLTIHNLEELKKELANARNSCDEDDDNDYGDDDFTKERLDNLLVSCPWIVHNLERNSTNLSDHYREYAMKFYENGQVKVRARNGDQLTGTWSTRVASNGALIKLEFDTLVDFTLEWFVHDISHGKIKLFTEGGNKIILEKNCDIEIDPTKEKIIEVLTECHWRIARLYLGDPNIVGVVAEMDNNYIGTPLKFYDDGRVKLRIHGDLVVGTWEILSAENTPGTYVLKMSFNDRPELNLHWHITVLNETLVRLKNQTSELILKRHCPDGDEDIVYINHILNNGKWIVESFIEINPNEVEVEIDEFDGYHFDFMEDGAVKALDGNTVVIWGSWLAFREDGLKLGLNFGTLTFFSELNHRWKIKKITEEEIELIDYSSDGSIERELVMRLLQTN